MVLRARRMGTSGWILDLRCSSSGGMGKSVDSIRSLSSPNGLQDIEITFPKFCLNQGRLSAFRSTYANAVSTPSVQCLQSISKVLRLQIRNITKSIPNTLLIFRDTMQPIPSLVVRPHPHGQKSRNTHHRTVTHNQPRESRKVPRRFPAKEDIRPRHVAPAYATNHNPFAVLLFV
jgi:hypothetical protein